MESSSFVEAVTETIALIHVDGFSGVLSATRGAETLVRKAWGMADRSSGLQNTPDTRFATASGTKLFTALGIARLVDARRIAFDTPVAELLPGKLGAMDPGVTIHHLLCHTSGVYDYYDEAENSDSDDFFLDIPWSHLETPSDYLPLFRNGQMVKPVGEPFRYNNGGFVLLAMVIETVADELYREFIEREVLGPAGMNHSGFFAFNQLPQNTASGYIDLPDGSWKTNIYNVPIRGGGDGGMYTTAADLDSFWRALAQFQIVTESTTETMLAPKTRVNESAEYGYGIYLGGRQPQYAHFIVGGDAGVGFDSRYFLKEDVVISILSNTTDGEEELRSVLYDTIAANLGIRPEEQS